MFRRIIFSLFLLLSLDLAACSSSNIDSNNYPIDPDDRRRLEHGRVTGEGISLFGRNNKNQSGGATIGVNSYLWRATLDTLAFMPLASADPMGGVVLTDWYEDPKAKGERFKVNALIIGSVLRADAIRITVFKQRLHSGSQWRDSEVNPEVARELENKILTRARELKMLSTNS